MSAAATGRLVRAGDSRPHFGFPWLALVLGVITLLFAGFGWNAITSEPEAQVRIVVEGSPGHGISQSTVDAAHTGPLRSWKPLTLKVTDDHLSYDQQHGRADLNADVVLSTQWKNAENPASDRRFTGAALRSSDDLDARFAIGNAYQKNLGLGHGPLAVVAAAETAADVLGGGPIRTPVFWVAGTGLGILLTGTALAYSLRRRRRWEHRYRRLATAQRRLARVVLDLEALEVTYRTTPERRRPAGYTVAWRTLRDSTLELARTEAGVMTAVRDPETALSLHTGGLVDLFEASSRELTILADALLAAGAVHANLSRSGDVFDRITAPLNDAARELIIRLEAAPVDVFSAKTMDDLRGRLRALLEASAHSGRGTTGAGVHAWAEAERSLEGIARHIADVLRRYPHGKVRARRRDTEDLSELRESLGLPGESSLALTVLDEANAVARALLGEVEAYDALSPARKTRRHRGHRGRRGLRRLHPDDLGPAATGRRGRAWWLGGTAVALVVSAVAAGLITGTVLGRPGWELTGTDHLRSLSIDGQAEGITEEGIRDSLEDKFPQPIDVTVAVRDAEQYLRPTSSDSSKLGVEVDPTRHLDALWRVKGEFPQLLDPVTGELRADQVIMPVMVFDDGRVALPGQLTGAVALGEGHRLGAPNWDVPHLYVSSPGSAEVHVSQGLEELARGLQNNGFREQNVSGALLFWLLTATLTLGLLTIAQVVRFGGLISARLGRFGRGGAALRTVRAELDQLALGLDDSRLNTVAVLGAGAASSGAEADQRLFERALVMAWREAADLAALPLSARLSQRYLDRVTRLQRLVATLGERDADVHRRTATLLEATRDTGG
ncbi:DUF5129 domain-containing protein [Arthrobacter rhombi]|uniref:DUF5129 domain-containing protein n=1 Tax=Arthrobacter rhombi TaxID=71253 RepID=UPI003FD1985A